MTSLAGMSGYWARTSAATPATYGAAKLVPWIVPLPFCVVTSFTCPDAPGNGLVDTMAVPGAATPTQLPARENGAGAPSCPTAATASTPSRSAGVAAVTGGRPGVFCGLQVPLSSTVPAATTTTTSRSTASLIAAVRSGSRDEPAGPQSASEMLMTWASASSAS